jgi:hypothetical protein
MDCQLEASSGAAEPLLPAERLTLRLRKLGGRALSLLRKATTDPLALLRGPTRPASPTPPPAPLDLRPGDRVRVRSVAAIRATLDATGRLRGLGYMPEMERYAGREMTVKKRVELFFDERTREMRKVKGIVLLEGATCEGRRSDPWDYAGCDRSCLLFWKEDWLERVPSAQS